MDMQLLNEIRVRKAHLRRLTGLRKYATFGEGMGLISLLFALVMGQPLLAITATGCMFLAANAKRDWLQAKQQLVMAEAAFVLDAAVNSPYAHGLSDQITAVKNQVEPTFTRAGWACYWRPVFVLTTIVAVTPLIGLLVVVAGLIAESVWPQRLAVSLAKLSLQVLPGQNGSGDNTVTLVA